MIRSTNLCPVCGHVYAHAQQVVVAAPDLPHHSDSDMTFLLLLNGAQHSFSVSYFMHFQNILKFLGMYHLSKVTCTENRSEPGL